MSKIKVEFINAELLVIGAGGAGARAALEAAIAGVQVALVCRSPLGKGGLTATANGGYHAAVWPGDSPATHANDLTVAGRYLNDQNLVRILTEEAAQQARRLEELGARVDWSVPPKPAEPEMSYPRSLFIPGKEVLGTLGRHLRKQGNVTLLEDYLLVRLLTGESGVGGAVFFNQREGNIVACASKATILASGSLGEIYPLTAQEPMGVPTGSTGAGYVMAGLAGADLVDMEMIQFTIMPVAPPLIRGMRSLPWGPLLNGSGEEFIPPGVGPYSHEAARAVWHEIEAGRGPVYMDLRDKGPVAGERHPLAAMRNKQLRQMEATPYQCPVEIDVGVLFMMGGVHINERCETGVPGLYAAGEVSANVHGARRVSGNALPEIMVFGARAGRYAAQAVQRQKTAPRVLMEQVDEARSLLEEFRREKEGIAPQEIRQTLRATMGKQANVVRDGSGLTAALHEIEKLEDNLEQVRAGGPLQYNLNLVEAIDLWSMVQVAQIVCKAALAREESRGFHYRKDFPEEIQNPPEHTVVRRTGKTWVAGKKAVQT